MAPMSWEYLAAFFDGEGTITLKQRGLQWSIAQSQARGRKLFDEIQAFLAAEGIRCGIYDYHERKNSATELHSLFVTHRRQVAQLCRAILPYTRIKKVEVQDHLRYMLLFPPLNQGPHWSMLMKERQVDWSNAKPRGWVKRRLNTSAALPVPEKPI